jgi:hypothetical protein
MLVSGLVVGADEERLLDPLLGHVLADHIGQVVVLERHHEAVLLAVLAGELGRAGEGADGEHARLGEGLEHRDHGVRGAEAGDEMHLVFLDQLRRALHGFTRIGLVVVDEQACRYAAELAAELLEGEVDRPLDLRSGRRDRSAELGQQTEPDLIGGVYGARKGDQHRAG